MENEQKMNKKILKITLKIKVQFPELSKYILELPITIPIKENPKINCKILKDYYNSLDDLLKNYIENQVLK